jgi:uncharacterized protein (DUF952 family)
MPLLYKICTAREWDDAMTAGRFIGSPADLADGFIHLSAGHQAGETARRHFAGQDGLVLVALPSEGLPGLKWEPSRGGDLFPHVYGPLATSLARWVVPLPLAADGSHRFPAGVLS